MKSISCVDWDIESFLKILTYMMCLISISFLGSHYKVSERFARYEEYF